MKRFEFPLEPVLRLKNQLLELEEARLAQLQRTEEDLLEQRQRLLDEAREQEQFLIGSDSVPGDLLTSYAAFQSSVRDRFTRISAAIEDCRRSQEEQRGKIRAIRVDLKLIDKLKKRQFGEWTRLLDKETEELTGEAFLNRLVRDMPRK